MKIKCIYNTGEILMKSQRKPLYVSEKTQYGELEIGREYLVMGILMNEGFMDYLIDGDGIISSYPSKLFDIVDRELPVNWFFSNDINEFAFIEAVWGYYELTSDSKHFVGLIEMDVEAHRTYFRRKIEMETFFNDKIY